MTPENEKKFIFKFNCGNQMGKKTAIKKCLEESKMFKMEVIYTISNHHLPRRKGELIASSPEEARALLNEWWKPFNCEVLELAITEKTPIPKAGFLLHTTFCDTYD